MMKSTTVFLHDREYHLKELTARAMFEISEAEPNENEIPVIAVKHGCMEYRDSEDPAAEMSLAELTDLAAEIFKLSGLAEGGEAKKPLDTEGDLRIA